ncbi:MAG TPA: PAS domain S-box protein [Bacteroidota bacterium]|nr:PAS domain S-box protein [Bacteroidota bacterium]
MKQEDRTSETERLLHLILANIDDLIAVLDLEGRRLYNSPSYESIFGPRNKLRGTDSFEEVHPDDRAMVRDIFRDTVRTGVGRRIVYRLVGKDGNVRSIESQGNVIRDAEGKPEKVIVVGRDITDRVRAEEERSRLFSAVEQAHEAIIITDAAGTILFVNPAFEKLTGYTREEALGKNPRFLKSGVQGNEFYREMWATLLRGEVWTGRLINVRKDGSRYQEEMVISPVRDSSGTVVNYAAVKRDTTLESQMAEQLRQAQKMESLRQLAGGISHDFNNILNVILGTFTLMRTKVKGDAAAEKYLKMGENAVQRGSDVGKRLAMFAQADISQHIPLALGGVVRDAAASIGDSIEKTIRVETLIGAELPLVQASQPQLYQSLLTLGLHARDAVVAAHTPDAVIGFGAVTVDGRAVHELHPGATARTYVRLTISDNGPVMPEEKRQRIFEPFLKSDPAEGARGLALATVYSVVKSHHGFIDVASEEGRGTTFTIYLPAIHVEAEPSGEGEAEGVAGGTETVLVVEDEEALRVLLEEVLRSRGYTVLSAADGVDGLESYAAHTDEIAAVIADMGLPRQSGFEMFEKIRQLNPRAKVILASGYLSPELKSKLFVAGAKAFIPKPFQTNDVLRKLREILDLPA